MKGIAVAGSILVDNINKISAFPKEGELTQIFARTKAIGGLVPNVGVDLKKLCPQLDVYALGKIGADDDGLFVENCFIENGIDVSGVVKTKGNLTSFTDVMSVEGGSRTFFTYPGASAEFGFDDIDFTKLKSKMLHLGYFLLLDKIDNGDGEKILKKAKECGIKTSIDLVSENSDRYKLVIPCLKYTDNIIINEVDAGNISGLEPSLDNIEKIARLIKDFGVNERVIIHAPEFGVCLSNQGFTIVPSLVLPKGHIKGSTGAGDAFCAGALLGIYNGLSDKEILETSSMVAANALSTVDATSGITDIEDTIKKYANYKRRDLCL